MLPVRLNHAFFKVHQARTNLSSRVFIPFTRVCQRFPEFKLPFQVRNFLTYVGEIISLILFPVFGTVFPSALSLVPIHALAQVTSRETVDCPRQTLISVSSSYFVDQAAQQRKIRSRCCNQLRSFYPKRDLIGTLDNVRSCLVALDKQRLLAGFIFVERQFCCKFQLDQFALQSIQIKIASKAVALQSIKGHFVLMILDVYMSMRFR